MLERRYTVIHAHQAPTMPPSLHASSFNNNKLPNVSVQSYSLIGTTGAPASRLLATGFMSCRWEKMVPEAVLSSLMATGKSSVPSQFFSKQFQGLNSFADLEVLSLYSISHGI